MKKYIKIIFFISIALVSRNIHAEKYIVSQKYLEDSNREYTFQEVLEFSDSKFTAIAEGHSLSKGFSESVFWVKVSASGLIPGKKYVLEVEFFPLDRLEFYDTSSGKTVVRKSGDSVSGSYRELLNRDHVFRYTPTSSSAELYFRIDTRSTIYFPIEIFVEDDFINNRFFEQYMMGMFFGIILVMLLYNFLIYINLRDSLYLYYVLFSLTIGFYLLVDYGYAKMFFWDDSEKLSNFMNPFFGICTAIAGIFLTIKFLDLRRKFFMLMRIFQVLIGLFIFLLASLLLVPYPYLLPAVNILVIASIVMVTYATFRAIIRKNAMAYFFGISFSGFLVIAAVSSMANLGLGEQNFISTYGFIISTVFETTVLSFALAYRINILRKQREYYRNESQFSKQSYRLLKNEVEVAEKIQSSILPSGLPGTRGIQIEAAYMPQNNIGGDLYDFVEIGENELGVLVADVTGHGIPAALLASRVSFSFSLQNKIARDPVQVLNLMNSSLYKKMAGQLLTAVYVCINTESKKLVYASAGHHPVIVWNHKNEKIIYEKPKGRLIGVTEETGIELMETDLETGDRILIFTDGLLEPYGFVESYNGLGAIVKLLKKTSDMDIHRAKDFIINDLSMNTKIVDDVTFVMIDLVC